MRKCIPIFNYSIHSSTFSQWNWNWMICFCYTTPMSGKGHKNVSLFGQNLGGGLFS